MKMNLNVVFLLTGSLAIFLVLVCGIATAQECNIAVVENKLPGENNATNNVADEFEEEVNNDIHVVRAGNLTEMSSNVLKKFNELGCDCIKNLYIVGHGFGGNLSVGNGEKGLDDTKRINKNNSTYWFFPLHDLTGPLCTFSTVWLVGCRVGHCQNARTMLYEVASQMKTIVKAPVDKITTYIKGHKEVGEGVIAYKNSGRWQVASAFANGKPDHMEKSADDKPKEKTTTAGTEFNCPCNGASYVGLQDCHNGCHHTLGCPANICDPIWVNNTCDKFGGNPVLTGGTGTATPSALLATSRDQKRVSGNLGSVKEHPAGSSASKSTRRPLAGWDDHGLSQPAILKDGGLYRMWFSGYDSSDTARIGYATSTDGVNWTKYSGNPVLQQGAAGSWDETHVYNPTVVKDGSTFKMWFTGYSTTTKHARIGYATSPDGMTWTKHPTYVLDVGASGAWDEDGVGECCVIREGDPFKIWEGDTYKMWFGGSDYYQWWRTGYATSKDGIVWTKYSGNPVLSEGAGGTWDEWGASAPAVIKDGSIYHMLYGGIDAYYGARIGYATSSDGKHWTKSTRNPLITGGLGTAWDNGDVFHATCFKDSNEELFKIFYRGYSADTNAYALGFAATTDFSGLLSTTTILYVNISGNCGDQTPCYTSIQAAIDAADTGAVINIAQGTYAGAILLNASKLLTLNGGWSSTFTSQDPNTTIIKSPKAPQGSLTLQMVTIKP